jgi:hypothetical protein
VYQQGEGQIPWGHSQVIELAANDKAPAG